MNQKYTDEEKELVIARYLSGEPVTFIASDTSIPRSTLYAWVKEHKDKQGSKELSVRNFQLLENKVKRLEGIIEILQSVDCTARSPLSVKLCALEELYAQYSVHMLCNALQVPRGTFYNHILRNKRDNIWYAKRQKELRIEIQKIYNDSNQIFGADKIAAVMKENGYRISVGMVRELMRDMGLISTRESAKALYRMTIRLWNHSSLH